MKQRLYQIELNRLFNVLLTALALFLALLVFKKWKLLKWAYVIHDKPIMNPKTVCQENLTLYTTLYFAIKNEGQTINPFFLHCMAFYFTS